MVAALDVALGRPWTVEEQGERLWMLVYPPALEQTVRARIPDLTAAARAAGHTWAKIDVTHAFGDWLLGAHDDEVSAEMFARLEEHVVERVRTALRSRRIGAQTIVVLVGLAALHPFVSVGRLLSAVEDEVRGRLLVLFPGSYDPQTGRYHLLDEPEGFVGAGLPVLPRVRRR